MRFFKAIIEGFSNMLNINGIASRGSFWFWLFFVCIFLCITLIIDGAYLGPLIGNLSGEEVMAFDQDTPKWLSLISLIVLIIPTITVAMRRINDTGYSKWWILLALTGVGLLPLIYFFVKKGRKSKSEGEQ
jgi:uncharacterized membrane protein YhaH (DUF805 family)